MESGLRRLLSGSQLRIERPPRDARVGPLGVAGLAGFADLFAGEADLCNGGDLVIAGNMVTDCSKLRDKLGEMIVE